MSQVRYFTTGGFIDHVVVVVPFFPGMRVLEGDQIRCVTHTLDVLIGCVLLLLQGQRVSVRSLTFS